MCHAYEQEFGDIRRLPSQSNLPLIFPRQQ